MQERRGNTIENFRKHNLSFPQMTSQHSPNPINTPNPGPAQQKIKSTGTDNSLHDRRTIFSHCTRNGLQDVPKVMARVNQKSHVSMKLTKWRVKTTVS